MAINYGIGSDAGLPPGVRSGDNDPPAPALECEAGCRIYHGETYYRVSHRNNLSNKISEYISCNKCVLIDVANETNSMTFFEEVTITKKIA